MYHILIDYNDHWSSYKSITDELKNIPDSKFINDSKLNCINNNSVWTIHIDNIDDYFIGSSLDIIINKASEQCSPYIYQLLQNIPINLITTNLKGKYNSFELACYKFDDFYFEEYEREFLDSDDKLKCIEQQYWWNIHYHPHTPVGHWTLCGNNIPLLLNRANEFNWTY